MAIASSNCPRCELNAKLRPRDFSDQAIATLVSYGDLDKNHVGVPVCDECYSDLRDMLIEHERALPTEKEKEKSTAASKTKKVS